MSNSLAIFCLTRGSSKREVYGVGILRPIIIHLAHKAAFCDRRSSITPSVVFLRSKWGERWDGRPKLLNSQQRYSRSGICWGIPRRCRNGVLPAAVIDAVYRRVCRSVRWKERGRFLFFLFFFLFFLSFLLSFHVASLFCFRSFYLFICIPVIPCPLL